MEQKPLFGFNEIDEIVLNFDNEIKKTKEIPFYTLLKVWIVMMIFFFLTVPVVYIRNEIYYISRDIAELRSKHEVLLEENRALKNSIELLRFKNEILDSFSVENGK
ncbi:MAG: hypothetical protein II923_02455 [Campylobacter sp.]|nr:hypothetical protein [Campylobacter sp.]